MAPTAASSRWPAASRRRSPDGRRGSIYRLAFARADMREGLDFHLERRVCQSRHLHQRRAREVAGEELAAGLPYLLALADVGDEDRHLDDIGHSAAGRLDQMTDLGEDRLGLGVFVGQIAAA